MGKSRRTSEKIVGISMGKIPLGQSMGKFPWEFPQIPGKIHRIRGFLFGQMGKLMINGGKSMELHMERSEYHQWRKASWDSFFLNLNDSD